MLEALICDGGAAREIDLLEPASRMVRHVRHAPVRDMLAVREREDP